MGSRDPPAWPPAVIEEQLGLFMRMADYFGVTPLPSPVRTPSRFAGTNNSCDISGSPEAMRVSTDVSILLHALQVLGPRTQASARYIGWLAVYQGDIELVHEDVDYTVQAAEGVAGELSLCRPLPLDANVEYDIVLCVRGPDSTCGESHAIAETVTADGVTVNFTSSPRDEAGTGLLEGVIPGVVFTRQIYG